MCLAGMRCYYDQQIFMLQGNGGVSRYFFELIQRLGKMEGVDPTLFAGFYGSQLPLRKMKNCRVIGMRRFKVGPLWPVFKWTGEAMNRALLRSLAPAIYHPTYYKAEHPRANTRTVITVYDMIHEKFPGLYPNDPTAELKRQACAKADAIICISESTRQDLLNDQPELAAKTSVVYLAASPDFTMETVARSSPGAPPYALFVGSRRDYKGFDLALDAWQRLTPEFPDLRLICVGGGAFTAAELDEIGRRGLGPRMVQRPASDLELAALYRCAEVLIYPSRYEGFGLPVLEAMACGCPVICSRSSSLPEVGGQAASYFEPDDANGLAERTREMLGDATARAAWIEAGRWQHKRFSWDKCARQTAEIYRACTVRA